MEEENSDLMTEFVGHVFFQHKSIVIGAIKNVTFRRILLVLVFPLWLFFADIRTARIHVRFPKIHHR